jgi:hypothetical protein
VLRRLFESVEHCFGSNDEVALFVPLHPALIRLPLGQGMKKASEYRQHADECRALAKQVPEGEQRDQLLEMARTWDRLADDREAPAQKHPEQNSRKTPTE